VCWFAFASVFGVHGSSVFAICVGVCLRAVELYRSFGEIFLAVSCYGDVSGSPLANVMEERMRRL